MANYMIIPTFDALILPGQDLSVHVNLPRESMDRAKEDGNRVVLLPLKYPVTLAEVSAGNVYEYGVEAEIVRTAMTVSGRVFHIRTGQKGRVSELKNSNGVVEALFAPEAAEEENLEDEAFRKLAVAAEALRLTPEQKYELLAVDAVRRGDLIAQYMDEFDQMTAEQAEKAAEQERRARRDKKDYKARVEAAGMPEAVRDEVDQVLEHYESAQPNDPERGTMESYLEFMTALKWKPDEEQPVDLGQARAILNRDHYGMDKVKERILQQLAVMTLSKKPAGSILLLVGAPGTGKTSMGKSIAEALGRKYARVSLGGIRDEAEIRGHRRTYIGAMPGRIMDGIKKAGAMNPVMVLDEIDKIAQGYEGNPASALLEVLDPEQNNTFTDHYMNAPYDLSQVFFICTANTTETIPGPLLDRMEVISLAGYTTSEKLEIARKYLLPRAMADAGLDKVGEAAAEGQVGAAKEAAAAPGQEAAAERQVGAAQEAAAAPGQKPRRAITVEDDALARIIEEYTMEAGVRGLKKQLDVLCRHTAADIVEHGAHEIVVTAEEVPSYLGNKRVIHDRALDKDTVGVVTGLAWTQVGGEILFIETRVMHGSGQLVITGQLGDVMKESAGIAASLVKALFIQDDLDFKDKDIHIHVPSGAVPKDGPSAGVALFTALTSLVTDLPVSRKLAMTGEISLRGQVMPIGGLPEKLMAADRAGIQKVLIPRANVQDLDDVAQETRDHLQIVPVDTVQDVLREALGIRIPSGEEPLFRARYERV